MKQGLSNTTKPPQEIEQIANPSDKLLPQILRDNPHAVKDYLRQSCSLQQLIQHNCYQTTRSKARAKEKAWTEEAASDARVGKNSVSNERLDEPNIPKPCVGGHLDRDEDLNPGKRVLVAKKGPEQLDVVCEEVLRLFRT